MTSRPLKIVLVMIEPPLPFGNAAARWFHVLYTGLLERGHEVSAFATCTRPEELEQAREAFPCSTHELFLSPPRAVADFRDRVQDWSQPNRFLFSVELRASLDARLSRPFDLLHLEQLWCGWLVPRPPVNTLVNVINLYEKDLGSWRIESWRQRVHKHRLINAERRLLRRFHWFTTLSDPMAEHIQAVNPSSVVLVNPLGLDLELYPFQEPAAREGPVTLGLIGSFNWQPTRAALERLLTRIWPRIRALRPATRLRIAGRSAHSASANLPLEGEVVLIEDFSEVEPQFRAIDLLLYAPSPASGMKVKVLEAAAFGIPVLTNPDGLEGLPAHPGVHMAVGLDDESFVQQAVELLDDLQRRRSLARQARKLVEAVCSPTSRLDRLTENYHQILADRPEIV